METQSVSGSEQKVQEYITRIKNGEPKESIMEGLPLSFVDAIKNGLGEEKSKDNTLNEDIKIPPQYEGLNSETLDFIWTIPEYTDPEKNKQEKEKKQKVLNIVKQKEKSESLQQERILTDQEDIEKIKNDLGNSNMEKPNINETDEFSEFRMKNGETDQGFFWNEYRNRIAKELKNSGQFEWGKERIYFDVPIKNCEKLRDLALKIVSENKIPIALKYIDDAKTFAVHKDGKETRFVMNFASSDDARKFYSFLAKNSEYKNLKPDRQLDYKGIRIDDLAEYASGFREERGGLERIMNASKNEGGLYEYLGESGKKITISEDEFNNFKEKYKKLEENINGEKKLWEINNDLNFQSLDNSEEYSDQKNELNENSESKIEKTANYEGNETLLFYERLQNPEIKKRLINMFNDYQDSIEPPERFFKDGKEVPISEWKKETKTIQQLELELDEKIKKVFSSTDIDYSKNLNSHTDGDNGVGLIYPYGIDPDSSEKWTKKQLSISEAHEKGHCIRNFYEPGSSFKNKILSGFDFSNIKIPERILSKNIDTPESLIKENFKDYFSRPVEIIERMAQLKNYFGMKGSEQFTKEHLEYAKLHYLNDTEMGESQMNPFFDAITPETEEKFLELINSLGI